ncbi:MAG TPA: citryl-CoA lyase [Vicinamibacterales bacterium]|nr:citryl-CoA lyase [Vicinamibacterales bacterium]
MGQDAPANSAGERRRQPRSSGPEWRTALTRVEKNRILIRGYPVDEMMGRLDYAEAVYLLLVGELPTPAIGKMISAILVSSLDHGATPPSTLVARNVATTGAPLRAAVAAGVLAFGRHHGGDVEACMRFLDSGVALLEHGRTRGQAAEEIGRRAIETGTPPPGFGHRLHSQDPRAGRLLQLAMDLELDGDHVALARDVERVLARRPQAAEEPWPLNVDGAIAAVCGDLGFDYELGNALFIISRVPGLIAHAHEERVRQRPMRQIDPKDHIYDGPSERRLPKTRT